MRWSKLKTERQASQATGHNYRQRPTLNADDERKSLNKEYVNTDQRPYWDLLTERIEAAGVKRVRSDSVRGMEVILTGSPDRFSRGEDGKHTDFSNTKWVQDNLAFLQDTFGKENVVAFTLHQDEKTPHIHAVVCPIYQDKKGQACLSADKLFNPSTLREYQTSYAAKMAPYGMERGIMHSQAKHQDMKRLYGQTGEVAQLVPAPAPIQVVELTEIPLFGRETWKNEQQAHINDELTRQVKQAQERANKAVEHAQTNASAQEQVKTLRKQLATAEGLKQAHFARVQELEQARTRLAVEAAQLDTSTFNKLMKEGEGIREEVKKGLTAHLEQILGGKVADNSSFAAQVKKQGYFLQANPNNPNILDFVEPTTGARFGIEEIRPNGKSIAPQLIATIERTQGQAQTLKKGEARTPKLG